MKAFYILGLIVLSCSAAAFDFNGKQYFTVTSVDPDMDTGAEVCNANGLGCVGYTEATDAVCKIAHPSSQSQSDVSGDMSGVYCDGAPQTGVCAGLTDTCLACPTCTNILSCTQEIGGLYREMYVECAGQCKITVYANDIQDLIDQLSSINAQLQGCPQDIPPQAGSLVKDGNTILNVARNSGSTESFTITISGNQVTGVSTGAAGACSQKIAVSEDDLNIALASQDIGQAAAYLLGQNKISVTGCTLLSRAKFFFVRPIARFFARRAAPSLPAARPKPNCGQVGEQCNNRH